MPTRRQFLRSTLAAGAAAVLTRPASAAPAFRAADVRTISAQPEIYYGWPTLAAGAAGELLLVSSGGREAHVCPFGRVDMMRSLDGGSTWTWPRTLLDSAIDDRDAGVLRTRRGTILVTTFTSSAWEDVLARAESQGGWDEARLERWRSVRRRLDSATRKAELGTWMLRSTDGGRTWSTRYDCLVNSPHGPIELADGRLLYAGKQLWLDDPRVGVCESTDDGATWRWLATLPAREGDDPRAYHELHCVETADGRVVLQIRNHNKRHDRETLQSESSDGGRTWSEPRSIGVWGLPSHLTRLRDSRLLMSYGHRRAPFGVQARTSDDGGASWSEPLVLHGDGTGGDLGYPSSVELEDGTIVTVWYELMAGSSRAVLRQARWRLET